MREYFKKQLIYFIKGSTITLFISALIPLIGHIFFKNTMSTSNYILNLFKLFFSLLPIIFLKQRNFLFKDGPLKATALILYYLILLPFINLSLNIKEDESLKVLFFIINITNIALIIISHIILLKYVFNDFFMRRRAIVAGDILVVFTTYITIAITFGLIFTILSIFNGEPAFSGISTHDPALDFYFKHIYFSFITIATVGYGDIVPLSTLARFFSIIEVLIGMLLTNVILGLVIGSGIFAIKKK